MMMTASVIYNGTEEQEQSIARMRGRGVLVTVWGAPDGYQMPAPIKKDDDDAVA
jgi:hypothetical protein